MGRILTLFADPCCTRFIRQHVTVEKAVLEHKVVHESISDKEIEEIKGIAA